MELWIIYDSNSNLKTIEILKDISINEFNLNVKVKDILEIQNNLNNKFYDLPNAVLMRTKEIKIMHYFESKGIKTFSSSFSTIHANDKMWSINIAKQCGFVVPKTMSLSKFTTFSDIKKELTVPFILKDNFGMKGQDVFLIKTKKEYDIILNNLNYPINQYIVQEYIKNSYGQDIRCYMLGDDCILSLNRKSNSGFKSNEHGSTLSSSKEYIIDDEILNKIKLYRDKLSLDIYSIDFLIDRDKLIFCEVNTNVGLYNILQNKNIAKLYIQYIIDNK